MSIRSIITTHYGPISHIAKTWLAWGASSFSVWSDDRVVATWPVSVSPAQPGLTVPIQLGGRTIAKLHVTGCDEQCAERLRSDAQLLGTILNAETDLEQMTAELWEAQDQLLALYELSQATRTLRTIEEAVRRLAEEAARLVKVQGALVCLPPLLVQRPAELAEPAQLLALCAPVLADGRELLLSAPEADLPAGVEQLYIAPVHSRSGVAAALGLCNRPGGFSAPDLKLARAIADHAGAQIENILLQQEMLSQERLRVELEVARRVQIQLLPPASPRVAHLDLFAQSRPALQVGGDFYDVVCEPGRQPIFLLGDVSGKGLSAAFITGMLRSIARSCARFMPAATPARVLSRTNHDLYDDLTLLEAFATMVVLQHDPAARQLRCANAGHAPLIYRPPGGPARLLESDSAPVGVLPLELCADQTLPFGPGALLLAATDGFNEARGPDGELFGYQRLLELVDRLADQPAAAIGRALFEAVDAFAAGRDQDDDQTLIVLKEAQALEGGHGP